MQRSKSLIIVALILGSLTAGSAAAQVSIGIGLPNVRIGINLPVYPELAPIPGYPVYYAPRVAGNYFFYDGMYWVFQDGNWYAAYWYDGPWRLIEPVTVPLFILRIPVRYYMQPPPHFRGWRANAPPRWGHYWGKDWEDHRRGWSKWDRRNIPSRAPLPAYQRDYRGERYPKAEQQQEIIRQQYRYQPRDREVRPHSRQEGSTMPPGLERKEQRGQYPDRQPDYDRRDARPERQEQRHEERHQEREHREDRHDRGQHRGEDRGR